MQERLSQQTNELPQLKKQLKTLDQQISNLIKIVAMGGLQGLETITGELQRLEKDKQLLTERIEEHTQEVESVQLTVEQIQEAIVNAREHVRTKDNPMIKHILSKFINRINVSNEAIEVEYNLGGFFVDAEEIKLLETFAYSKESIYNSMMLHIAV